MVSFSIMLNHEQAVGGVMSLHASVLNAQPSVQGWEQHRTLIVVPCRTMCSRIIDCGRLPLGNCLRLEVQRSKEVQHNDTLCAHRSGGERVHLLLQSACVYVQTWLRPCGLDGPAIAFKRGLAAHQASLLCFNSLLCMLRASSQYLLQDIKTKPLMGVHQQ